MIGAILLAVWLILFGVYFAGWVSMSNIFLGLQAVITGAIILIELIVHRRPLE